MGFLGFGVQSSERESVVKGQLCPLQAWTLKRGFGFRVIGFGDFGFRVLGFRVQGASALPEGDLMGLHVHM